MPAIFDEQGRTRVRAAMINAGFDIVRAKGFRRLTVDEVTRQAGIAKGTFYSFFPSKEEFVYQIVAEKRAEIVRVLEQMASDAGGRLDRAGFKEWLQRMWKGSTNIYLSLSVDDWEYLSARWPAERAFDPVVEQETASWILERLEGLSPHANWKVFANLQKALGFLYLNSEALHADALDETADAVFEAMCTALFEN